MSLNSPVHIRMSGRDVVAGLLWQPPQRQYSSGQIRDLARELGSTRYVMRKLSNKQLQVAFEPKGGTSVGRYSLAAMLSQSVRHANWAGVFALPNGSFVFICVLDGAVMPGTDVVGDFDEIRSRFVETIDLISGANQALGVVYAPKLFGEQWQDQPLETLIGKTSFVRSAKVRVIPGNVSRRGALVIGGATAVGGLAIWYGIWGRKQFGMRFGSGARRAPPVVTIVDVPPPKPWTHQVEPDALSRFWIESISELPVSIAGWTISHLRAEMRLIVCEYTRGADALPMSEFLGILGTDAALKISVDDAGAKAVVEKPLKALTAVARAPGYVLSGRALRENWVSDFQRLGDQPPPLESVPPEPPTEGPPASTANVRYRWKDPDWQVFKWTFRSPIAPDALFAGWRFPGLALTAMEMGDLSNGPAAWQLEGVIYASTN